MIDHTCLTRRKCEYEYDCESEFTRYEGNKEE